MQRTIVLVTGMHRSGTSYLSSLCQLLGLGHASVQFRGNVWNLPGYFEAQEVVGAHDELMIAMRRPWWDMTPWPDNWNELPPARMCLRRLVTFAKAELPLGDVVIKDPRASLLLPLWREVCQATDTRLVVLACMRPAGEVASSLLIRNDLSALPGIALWWRYTTAIWRELAAGSPLAHAFVFYHHVLADPEKVYQLLNSLDVRVDALTPDIRDSIRNIARPTLRHQTTAPPAVSKDALRAICDEIYDYIMSSPSVPPGAQDLPGSDLVRRMLTWYPHWRSLFMRHDHLLQRTRSVHNSLTGLEAIGGPHQ
jgi:hypothetical protein